MGRVLLLKAAILAERRKEMSEGERGEGKKEGGREKGREEGVEEEREVLGRERREEG